MRASLVVFVVGLSIVAPAPAGLGCFAPTPDERLQVVGSFDGVGDVEVSLSWYAGGGGYCAASLRLDASRLNSLRFTPRPLDVLRVVRAAVERWHPRTCSAWVVVADERSAPDDYGLSCSWGEYRLEASGWDAIDEGVEAPC